MNGKLIPGRGKINQWSTLWQGQVSGWSPGTLGFPCSSVGIESACSAGSLIPGLGRSPGGEHGYPLQYSCLEYPINRGAWQATVHGVARVRHDLMTKPPPPGTMLKQQQCLTLFSKYFIKMVTRVQIEIKKFRPYISVYGFQDRDSLPLLLPYSSTICILHLWKSYLLGIFYYAIL